MAVDSNCSSKQTFCKLGKQTVSQNSSINFSYDGCVTANEIINNETWNELINAIIKVYNFGTRGTRNPSRPFSLNADQKVTATTVGNENNPSKTISNTLRNTKHQPNNASIDLNDYNEILSSIGMTNKTGTQIIYGTYFKEIMDTLNSYKLNNTRCNNCNTGCNVKCQASAQCCDSYCCTECCTNTSCNCQYTCEASYDMYGGCRTTSYGCSQT